MRADLRKGYFALFCSLALVSMLHAQFPINNSPVIRSTAPPIFQKPRSIRDLDKPDVFARQSARSNAPTPQTMPRPESLVRFDPTRVELQFQSSQWYLHGGGLLKTFGKREEEARKALHLIRSMHLNQKGSVGEPLPVFEYWLSDGKAPSGLADGLRTITFKPNELRVENVYGEWFLRDNTRVLFRFGPQEQEARQALAVIQKYGFESVALVGQAVPSMYVFLRHTRDGVTGPVTKFSGELKQEPFHKQAAYQEAKSDLPEPRQRKGKLTTSHVPTSMIPQLRRNFPTTRRDTIAQTWTSGGFQSQQRSPSQTPTSPKNTNRIAFDWRQARLSQEKGEWILRVGKTVLADLGTNYHIARLAYASLLHYQFNEMHQINPEVEETKYFLVRGQPPRGLMPGLSSMRIQPSRVTVREHEEEYHLMQRGQFLVNCGKNREDAEAMLQVLRKHNFDRLCRARSGFETRFQFFVRTR